MAKSHSMLSFLQTRSVERLEKSTGFGPPYNPKNNPLNPIFSALISQMPCRGPDRNFFGAENGFLGYLTTEGAEAGQSGKERRRHVMS